ncbi:MAG: zinc ribbon domain-containing protein [Clostridia bacterium]|nr:zinc ribbon domain-containing protein [Clostridia bacterium]
MKYCTNCGKPVDPSASFCTNCGSPIAPEAVSPESDNNLSSEPTVNFTEQTPSAPDNTYAAAGNNASAPENGVQPPVNPLPYTNYNGNAGGDAPKPKSKKIFIPILAAIAALIAAGVIAFFTLPVFQNFVMRTFAPKSTYLGYVIKQNMVSTEPLEDIFKSTYNADISISIDDELIDIIGKSAGLDSKTTGILKAVNDAGFSNSARLNDTQFADTVTARLNGKEIGTADISADFESQIAFIDLNDLNDKAFGADVPEAQSESYLIFGRAYSIIEDNEKDIESLASKYMKTALSDIKVKKGSQKIEAGDYSKKYSTLSFTLDDKTVKNITKDILKDAKKDKKLKNLIVEFAGLDENLEISKSDIEDYIDEALENIDDIDFKEEIDVRLFVDNTAKIRGITINEDESDFEFFYADVNKGFNFATDFSVSAYGETAFEITGEGTEKHNNRTGEYTVSVNAGLGGPMDICKFELDDFSAAPLKGQISFSLTSNAYNMLSSELNLSKLKDISDLLKNGKLVLDINKSGKSKFEGSLSLSYSDANLISIDIDSSKDRGSDIDFPDDYTSSESDWQNSINIFGLMSRLKDTGIPMTDLMR